MNQNLLLFLLKEEEEDDDILLKILMKRRKRIKSRYKSRNEEGYCKILIENHLLHDEKTFKDFFRLSKKQVDFILNLVGNNLKKPSSRRVKYPISPKDKLLLTLRFLATGESFRSLTFGFRISCGYISRIVRDVLKELCDKLIPIFLPQPDISNFEDIANDFMVKWNFPNCIGALHGKHIRILCPKNGGSLYSNYKNYFSIVLLALVDANCKFIIIDVGSYGKEGDNEIFEKSVMSRHINSGNFPFPAETALPASDIIVPHVIISDEASKLTTHIMKPYPKNQATQDTTMTVYNYRLYRARRVAENAFGILSECFRIFYTRIAVLPETAEMIVTATCCLHNMLRDEYLATNMSQQDNYEMNIPIDNNMFPLNRTGGFANIESLEIRNKFRSYFNTQKGSLQWQENYI